jgi:CRP-like cAMP-binding protein
LAGIPDDELDAVASAASEREFAAGETLMSEGDFGHCLFLVEEALPRCMSTARALPG